MSSSMYIDNKNKDILILGEGTAQGLDNLTLTAEAKYLINFSRSNNNGSNSFVFVNKKIYQFKAKHSEIKKYPLFLGNIPKDFTANNMKKNRIKWIYVRFFC